MILSARVLLLLLHKNYIVNARERLQVWWSVWQSTSTRENSYLILSARAIAFAHKLFRKCHIAICSAWILCQSWLCLPLKSICYKVKFVKLKSGGICSILNCRKTRSGLCFLIIWKQVIRPTQVYTTWPLWHRSGNNTIMSGVYGVQLIC